MKRKTTKLWKRKSVAVSVGMWRTYRRVLHLRVQNFKCEGIELRATLILRGIVQLLGRIYVCRANTVPYSGGRLPPSLFMGTGSGPASRSRCGNPESGKIGSVSETEDDACSGGWVEVAIEVVDRIVWCIFRVAELPFSLTVEAERIYSPRGVAVEDITGGVNTTGSS